MWDGQTNRRTHKTNTICHRIADAAVEYKARLVNNLFSYSSLKNSNYLDYLPAAVSVRTPRTSSVALSVTVCVVSDMICKIPGIMLK